MVAQGSIWDNEEFMEWFNSRPVRIQAAIRYRPPDKRYRVNDGPFPAMIHSYNIDENDEVTMKVDVLSPLMPRRVFGVHMKDLVEA